MMNLNWLETFSDSVRLNFDQSFHKDLFVFRIYLPINEIFIIEQDQVLAYVVSDKKKSDYPAYWHLAKKIDPAQP